MLTYLVRRIVFGAAVLVGTSLITFLIAFVVPADPAISMAGAKADPQTLASTSSRTSDEDQLFGQMTTAIATLSPELRAALDSSDSAASARRSRERAELHLRRELVARGIVSG